MLLTQVFSLMPLEKSSFNVRLFRAIWCILLLSWLLMLLTVILMLIGSQSDEVICPVLQSEASNFTEIDQVSRGFSILKCDYQVG